MPSEDGGLGKSRNAAEGDVWEDLSQRLTDLTMADDHKKPTSDIDLKIMLLLDTVDQYQALTRQSRLNYVQGYLNLSRANFHAGLAPYGPSSFDMRPHEPSLLVDTIDGGLCLRSVLSKSVSGRASIVKDTSLKCTVSSLNQAQHPCCSSATGSDPQENVCDSKKVTRNRNAKKKAQAESNVLNSIEKTEDRERISHLDDAKRNPDENEMHQTLVKDPIYQFGALVPVQLRNAQLNFQDALNTTVLGYNLKIRIANMLAEIETAQKLNDSQE